MNILVFGGSPKGKTSVTMQYVCYLEQTFPDHNFTVTYPGQAIKKLEKSEESFLNLMNKVKKADRIIFATPVYFMMIPGGLKRFIELINERDQAKLFKDKPAALLVTSIHYYDHTALNYLHAVCDDWDMVYTEEISAKMNELLDQKMQVMLRDFASRLMESKINPPVINRLFAPLPSHSSWIYQSQGVLEKISLKEKKIVIITDSIDDDSRLERMISRFQDQYKEDIPLYRLDSLLKGNCLGCLKCGPDNICAYQGKDGYIEAFKEWMKADMIIMAGTIKDRFLSAFWKTAFDRSFWRTHQPSFLKKQMAWLISGPLSHEQNLKEIIFTYTEMQGAHMVGIVTDEEEKSALLDRKISDLAERIYSDSCKKTMTPTTFRKIGGNKILRDDVAQGLKIIFRQDHKTYRRTGVYDFPLRNPLKRGILTLGYLMTSIPFIKKKMIDNMAENMIRKLRRRTWL